MITVPDQGGTDAAFTPECVVVCHDPEVFRIVQFILNDLRSEPRVCSEPEAAVELMRQGRFRSAVVDCDVPGAFELVQWIRNDLALVVLALVSESGQSEAFRSGATLVAHKPLNQERVRRALNAMQNLAGKQRRRTQRFSLQPVAHLWVGESEFTARISDLSETGVAVETELTAPVGSQFPLKLLLPGVRKPMQANARVVRALDGRLAMRFLNFPVPEHQRLLSDWLGYLAAFSSPDRTIRASEPQPAPVAAPHHVAVRKPQKRVGRRLWGVLGR